MNFKPYYEAGIDYDQYENLLGENLDLHQLHYKKFKVTKEIKQELNAVKPVRILFLTEPWCGDSLAIFPVMMKIAAVNQWPIKFLLRDDNPDLMDQFLTNNGRAIPIIFFLDDDYSMIFKFGPRPAAAQAIFEEHRADINAGKIEKIDVIKKIRRFYAKDRGKTIANQLIADLKQNRIIE
ncbi:MAG: thioredoxin family protein [bacterium]|nr:thioredoxin family protein [bacterium]